VNPRRAWSDQSIRRAGPAERSSLKETEVRTIAQTFNAGASGTAAVPSKRDRALGAADLDRIAAAGGPNSGGLGSGGGSGGNSN
jgi:hypothetical protein